MLELLVAGKVQTVGGGVHAEGGDGTRGRIGMFGEEELRARFTRRIEILRVKRLSSAEVGPSVPKAGLDAPQNIRSPPHRPTAAVVVAIVRDVELAIWSKRKAERVAKAPGDLLQV